MSKFLVTALLAALVVLTGCGEEERQPASGGDGGSQRAELRTVYTQDPTGGLDPDAFYDIEGESTILSVYEGLLRYKEGTSQLEPSLARSYAVSSDGRTYTFALRRASSSTTARRWTPRRSSAPSSGAPRSRAGRPTCSSPSPRCAPPTPRPWSCA